MSAATDNLDAYWMPFTANRDFKKKPRIITGASGHHYTASDGSKLYDTFSGLCRGSRWLLTVQEEVSRLSERLDFTEKLLMSGDDAMVSDGSE